MSMQIRHDVGLPALETASPRRRRNWKRRALLLPSVLVVTLFLVAAIFADLLSPYDPLEIVLPDRLIPAVFSGGTWDHPLGTDQLGRDILARTMHGARISLMVVVIAVPAAAAVGTLVGLTAGWRLGWADRVLMRLVDMQLAFPALLFAVLVAAVWGPSLRNVILIITLWTWSGYARLVRGTCSLCASGSSSSPLGRSGRGIRRVLARHVLPNLLNVVVILMTMEVATVILFEAGLSFLNVGVEAGVLLLGDHDLRGAQLHADRLVADLDPRHRDRVGLADRHDDGRLGARRGRPASAQPAVGFL